jgi:hypothetical protein
MTTRWEKKLSAAMTILCTFAVMLTSPAHLCDGIYQTMSTDQLKETFWSGDDRNLSTVVNCRCQSYSRWNSVTWYIKALHNPTGLRLIAHQFEVKLEVENVFAIICKTVATCTRNSDDVYFGPLHEVHIFSLQRRYQTLKKGLPVEPIQVHVGHL